jgi:hypothetical protein
MASLQNLCGMIAGHRIQQTRASFREAIENHCKAALELAVATVRLALAEEAAAAAWTIEVDQGAFPNDRPCWAMGKTREQELHEQIAHYRGLRRMTVDKRALEALTQLLAEAEDHLRQLELAGAPANEPYVRY